MKNVKDIISLNQFAQFTGCRTAVHCRLVTGDWRLSPLSKISNLSTK